MKTIRTPLEAGVPFMGMKSGNHFDLVLDTRRGPHMAGASIGEPIAATHTKRMLVLSDRTTFRAEIVSMFGMQPGGDVAAVGSASELFSRLAGQTDQLVVVDLDHGGDDPLGTIRQVRARWPHVVVAGVAVWEPRDETMARDAAAPAPLSPIEWVLRGPRAVHARRAPEPRSTWQGLTPRQREVLSHVGDGEDNLKIAACLGISERAVKAHVSALLNVFGVDNRTQLAIVACLAGVRDWG